MLLDPRVDQVARSLGIPLDITPPPNSPISTYVAGNRSRPRPTRGGGVVQT